MQKAIFIDVDGTLINYHGTAPDSAKLAIRKARENGHLIFLCTGRSKSGIFPEILDIGFDGIIGAAGGYIEMNEEILFHENVKRENIQHLVAFFTKHGIDFFMESNDAIYAGGNSKKRIQELIDRLQLDHPKADRNKGFKPLNDRFIEGEDLIREDINKISFLGSDLPLETIRKEFESSFTVIPSTVPFFGDNGGELSIPGIHKASAIEKLIQHLEIKQEDTFAYGDSYNDLEMLQFVQHGIAMENAIEAVKEAADDITNTPDEDGIYNSFKKYQLI